MNTLTFSDLLTAPPDLATLRGLWLVFSGEVAAALEAKQAAHGSPVHRVAPVAGPDGRFALCADLVSEIGPGGIHAALFATFDHALFPAVEVAPLSALTAAGWFAPAEESQS